MQHEHFQRGFGVPACTSKDPNINWRVSDYSHSAVVLHDLTIICTKISTTLALLPGEKTQQNPKIPEASATESTRGTMQHEHFQRGFGVPACTSKGPNINWRVQGKLALFD
ncbi:hypothetical protein AVEN_169296-1 [Araneus ventricosus]|uniref:Uncharacterized protein n=1 Tax=Araneus ventricosus TaxID=182803 RepID=A0A4Y2HF06_ARAVE|nr:hypothetical protein AVEN_169296-1 [Araneus ventricosus]